MAIAQNWIGFYTFAALRSYEFSLIGGMLYKFVIGTELTKFVNKYFVHDKCVYE